MPTATRTRPNLDSLGIARETLRLEWDEIAAIVGVNRSTLHRWRTHESMPRPMAWSRLAQLEDLLQLLPRVFAGPDLARTWLTNSRPNALGGRMSPLDVMKSGRIDRVLGLLQYLARGA